MANTSFNAQVIDYKKLRNSASGNPQYMFTLHVPKHGRVELRTAANHMFVYSLAPSKMVGHWFTFEVRGETRRAIINVAKVEGEQGNE